jgi:predicted RNase H-like nuclease (RuvC/YqgF family)
MKEINNMNLHQRTIEDKIFSKLKGNFVFKSEQPIIRAYKILEDTTKLYISGTQLNATIEDKFNKGDYIVEDKFENFINISKEDFEAKYKVIEKESIEKESFDNIIDETKKVLTDKSNEYNGLKKELESAKVEIERLREKLNGIENNFKSLS